MPNPTSDTMFTRLYLIRHGQTDVNKEKKIHSGLSTPLNENGIMQAKAISERMNTQFPFDVIISSPADRALKTAHLINKNPDREVLVDPDLVEVGFGSLMGHTLNGLGPEGSTYIEEFEHFILTNREMGTIRPELPNGEPIDHIQARINAFIGKVLSQHQGKRIAVVSHGSYLKCMITTFSGESLKNYMPYWIDNASISIVDFYGRLPIIRVVNDSSHLGEPLQFAVPRII